MDTKELNRNNSIVPTNLEGKPVDIQKSITEKTVDEAVFTYHSARLRLLTPDAWSHLPEFKGASFKLIKSNVAAESSLMELNDCIRIALPGPGPTSGDGYDWVKVENVLQDFDAAIDESFGITLRACANPFDDEPQLAAHFFKQQATSTFILMRSGKEITASYHGRNEVPNVAGNNLHDKVRNAVVALGALSGLSELQWRILLNSLLTPATDDEAAS